MKNIALALLHSLGFTQKKLATITPENAQHFYDSLNLGTLINMGISMETATKIMDRRTDILVERVTNIVEKMQVRITHISEPDYPSLLATIPNAPTILYVRGNLPTNDALISIVGSRKHSDYSAECLRKIIPDLVRSGYGIISGGAYGIDSVAHTIAMKSGGYTAAVFGAGIDVIYPPSNERFFEEIIATGGCLISQFPLGMIAEPFNFPIRNEVVAGMSRGTLIAEAGEDSGTLITARLAVEANRDVFVIPSDITRTSALGSNALIRDGLGKLILSADDILSEYQLVDRQLSLLQERPAFSHPLQESLYEILCMDTIGVDLLAEKLGEETSAVMHALALMEIEGIVESRGGVYSVR